MKKSYLKTEMRLPWLRNVVLLFMMLLFAIGAKAQTHECGSDYIHNQKMQTDPVYVAKMQQYENKLLKMSESGNIFQTMSTITPPYKIPVVVHVMQDGTSLTAISKDVIKREILRLNQRMRKIQASLGDGNGTDVGFEFALAIRDVNGNSTEGITYYNLSGNSLYVSSGVKFQSTDAGMEDIDLKNLRRWDPSKYYNIWLVNKIGGGNPNTAGGYAQSAGSHGQNDDGSVILATQFNSLDAVTAHELGHAFNLEHTFEGSNGSNCPLEEITTSTIINIGQMVPANQGTTFIATASSGYKYYVSQIFIQNNGGFASPQQINSWGTTSLPNGVHYINKTQHLLIQTSDGSRRYFIHKNYFLTPGNVIPEINWLDDWNPYALQANVYSVAVGQQNVEYFPSNHCNQSGDKVCDTPRHQKTLTCDGTNSCGGASSVANNYMSYASGSCQNVFTLGQKARMVAAMQLRKSFLASEGNMSLVPAINPVADFILPGATVCIGSTLKLYDNSKNIPNTFLDETAWQGISFSWTVVKEGATTHTTNQQNPALTFTALGNYAITLSVTNQYGTHSKTQQIKVVAPIATAAVCASPGSVNLSSNYGYSVNNVTFNTINNSTDLGINGVYTDYSCQNGATTVDAGAVYSLKVSVKSDSSAYRFEAYIDWNNDGLFAYPGELVSAGTGTANQNITFAGDLTIPTTAVMGTLLRMRIIADNVAITDAKRNCTQAFTIGDTEDYGVFVNGTPLCPPGNVTFTTQQQVNAFAVAYPNCTAIAGFLAITNSSGATAITNLSALNGITNVSGSLDISTNSSLTNLNGLQNIVNVGGDLKIADNPGLINTDGLSNLTGINGFLAVTNNATLTNISGLQNVNPATIVGINGLTILNNALLSVCNLPNICTYLGGNGIKNISGNAGNCISTPVLTAVCYPPVCPEGNVTFTTQAQLNQFAIDYPTCTAISGTLSISGSAITSLVPLNGITSVSDNIYINTTALNNLNGLNNVATVGGDVEISNNTSLTTLTGLSSLTNALGNLAIIENAALTNVDALTSLTNINGHLVVYNNAGLTSISGLQNVNPTSIGGEYGLYISNNPQLSVCNNINFCVYLLYPANTHPRNISGNGADCISEQALSAICNPTPAQCPTADVTLVTQAEVNQFAVTYPNCSTITGNLRIGVESGSSNITDLSPLHSLTIVTGNLFISYNGSLPNLIGLGSISNVGGLFIQNNGLNNLNGLSALTNAGNLLIAFNSSLTNVNGLSGLTSIAGSAIIQNNNVLTNINGLNNLTTVSGLLTIQYNNALSNISGLQNVNPATLVPMGNIGLTIKNNAVLSVCNLPNLCTYLGNVSNPRDITGNAGNCISSQAITNACTATPVNSCPTGTITFTSQAQVNQFLINYPNCTEITGDLIIGPYNLVAYPTPTSNITNLAPLSNITKIGGRLVIERNPSLQNLNGLGNLLHIGGDFSYRPYNASIGITPVYPSHPLVGLNNLTSIGGDVSFMFINKFNGLNNLTTVGGSLNISITYPGITPGNMDGFSSLTTVGGTLRIFARANITNLDGLSSLTTTGGLQIENNNTITNLDGLSNLTSVGGGSIAIQPSLFYQGSYNTSLISVSGLQNVNPETINGLYLTSNRNLAICDLPNFCTYLSNPANPRQIYDNKPSCNLNALLNTCATQQIACSTGDVYLGSQDDVNQFAIDYPNCNSISGDLYITNESINSLTPLSNITHITGNLYINDTSLTNLGGLHNLTSLGGSVTNGFNSTSSTGSSVTIKSNSELISISSLQNINPATINGLYILQNYQLSVCNLPNFCTYLSNVDNPRTISQNAGDCVSMTAVAAACGIEMPVCPPGDVVFGLQYSIADFAVDYPNCTQIAGSLKFFNYDITDEGNNMIVDLSPLSNLTGVTGDLIFEGNWKLTSLIGLHNLTSVGGAIKMEENYLLSNISALNSISSNSFNNLVITENPQLSVCNLPNFCTYLSNPAVTHPRTILDNLNNCLNEIAVLATCSNSACPTGTVNLFTQTQVNQFVTSYPNCSLISGNLNIDGQTAGSDPITNLTGLSNIQTVTGQLNVVHNPQLNSLSGLDSVKNVGSNLWIADNTSLYFMGNVLSTLETVGQLYIGYHPNLYSVGQFSSLTTITWSLTIENNPGLSDLNGFSNLTNVGVATTINNNAGLTDISGFQNINAATLNNLIITNNPMLSVCNQSNICTYLAGSGSRTISGNSGGCATEQAVSNACSLSTSDNAIRKISYHPNPVQDRLYLAYDRTIDQVSIVNILGQTLINQKVGANKAEIDLSMLAGGNYFVRITSDSAVHTIKIIKK